MPGNLIPLAALIIWLHATLLFAQQKAFETISVGATMGYTISGNELLDSWDSKPSLQLNFRTPFYAGELESGLRYSKFTHSPELPDYSDFRTTYIFLGWGYDFAVSENLFISPLLRFGTKFFHYKNAKRYPSPSGSWFYAFDSNESEFAYELIFRGTYRLSDKFSAYADLSYNRTLTYHPIQLNYLSAGIMYTFDTPNWLRKGLK
ncbi:hypothetical protein G3570_13890 [Balneolaceae bacterium YR4-1]|uniref:Outer membrane protein beta-barrel domain-containing protein n=1 Tax=Halalkalibaculum roseum TaxID=2709311 RepID=A0A6M1T2J2_9BACT|nr:hypothetical protein [Halalkalibaculum roseum]NGP77734.1 hypothetical protein [Halalkalibaculum roseum]